MDDQQGANRQGGEQRTGGGESASKGINPVQHSERGINPVQHSEKGINPVQHSEGRQDDDNPGRGNEGGGRGGNEKGNG